MATIYPTITDASGSGSCKIVKWVLNTTGDVGSPFKLDRWAVTSFHVYGTTITALALNGSMEPDAPANFSALSDWQGNSLGALAAAGLKTPRDLPVWIQPTLTTGSAVTVIAACHRVDMGAVA